MTTVFNAHGFKARRREAGGWLPRQQRLLCGDRPREKIRGEGGFLGTTARQERAAREGAGQGAPVSAKISG